MSKPLPIVPVKETEHAPVTEEELRKLQEKQKSDPAPGRIIPNPNAPKPTIRTGDGGKK